MILSFTIAVGPRQCSHSRVLVPYFTVSDSKLSQPGGPGPRIYVPQKQGGLVILPDTEFPFRRPYDSQGYGGGIQSFLHEGFVNIWISESIFMELSMYITASELISTAHFINSLHQFMCLYLYPIYSC
jgi:hypothetical protein